MDFALASILFIGLALNRRYLQTPCELLVNNQTMLYTISANAEIGIGFTLIFMFVT